MPSLFLDSPCYGELERKMVQTEELAELQDIVEHGPDWNELVIGTITLQRRLEALPSRTAEHCSQSWRQ